MKESFNKFLIYIIINIFIFIKSQDSKIDEKITCKKLTIDKYGKISKINIIENSTKNDSILSIQYNESFIIYDCLNNNAANDCIYENPEIENEKERVMSRQDCIKRDIQGDKDKNICCYYVEKDTLKNHTISGCLEINIYEFQRFKWALSYDQFIKNSYNNKTNETFIEIECNDKINKINIFTALLFLITLINL